MRKIRRSKASAGEGSPTWMSTYSDMVTLLLCFFICMYAFSVVDINRFQAALISIQGSLGLLKGNPALLDEPGEAAGEEGVRDSQMGDVAEKAKEFLESRGLQEKVKLVIDERGLILRFQETVLFDRGEARLKAEAKTLLSQIEQFLKTIPNQIRVEGHTCNLPISSHSYPSNWELSTARATTVIQFFVTNGLSGERLSAVGYGEYRPVAANTGEVNRRQNRRVDILIVKENLGSQEPGVLDSLPSN